MTELALDNLTPNLLAFMLVVGRLSGLFLLAPVFSSAMLPMRIKIMVLLALAYTITPLVVAGNPDIPIGGLDYMIVMIKEILIGLAIGFSVNLIFTAVQLGASMVDLSIGLSMASVVDPLNNVQASVLGSFYTMIATLTFLAVNGHHLLIAGFMRSFDIVALDGMLDVTKTMDNLATVFGQLFTMAFQIAAPVLITLLVVDVMLGIVSRVVPQMNVFFVGVPLKLGVGLIAIIICLPMFSNFFQQRLDDALKTVPVIAQKAESIQKG